MKSRDESEGSEGRRGMSEMRVGRGEGGMVLNNEKEEKKREKGKERRGRRTRRNKKEGRRNVNVGPIQSYPALGCQ